MRLLKKRALPSSPGELELRRGASDLGEGDSAALETTSTITGTKLWQALLTENTN